MARPRTAPRAFLQAPAEPIRVRPLRIDDRTTPARLTFRVIGGAPHYTVPAALLSITHQLGEALVPVLMGLAIERAVMTGDPLQLVLWIGLLAADFAVLSFSWRFGSRIGELGLLAVQHELRSVITRHLLRPDSRSSTQPGVALSLATSDANRLSSAVDIGLYCLGQFAAIVFGGIVLLTISWPLGLAVLVGAPLLLWCTDRAGSGLRRQSGAEQASAAEASGRAADLMAGYRVIRGLGAEDEAAARYRRASRRALSSTLRARRSEGIFTGTMDVATGLFLTAIAVAAALSALAGSIGLGEFITVIGLTQFLIAPLQSVAKTVGTLWASATASGERLLALLREEGLDTVLAVGVDPSLVQSIVNDLLPGELVVVRADAHLSKCFLDVMRNDHQHALVVPHAAHLFAGSVAENVCLPGVDPRSASSALTAACCDDFLDSLPAGHDTPVGENGGALSGGQRQRVALARALAQDAPLLILHDPTTAVDAVTEAAIAGRLRAARAVARTVIVTLSPAFHAVADRVITLADPGPMEER